MTEKNLLLYKEKNFPGNTRIIFLSGLGLKIRKQREAFFRRYAELKQVSYTSLDYTAHLTQSLMKNKKLMDGVFEKTKKIVEKYPEDKLFLIGVCFGGKMALKLADQLPNKVAGIFSLAPFHEQEGVSWVKQADEFLRKRFLWLKNEHKNYVILREFAIFHQLIKLASARYARDEIGTAYTGPIEIVHGEKDYLIPPESSMNIQKSLKNKVNVHVIKRADHTIRKDFECKGFLKIIDSYVSHTR